jgi:hypothetical protein
VSTGAALRPPPAVDPTASAYKDWLHVNLLDHRSGTIGLVNVSLHGDPADPPSRAVGTALLHVPGAGWAGNTEIVGFDDASVGVASIALEHVAIAVERDEVLVSAQLPDDDVALELTASFAAPAVFAEQPLPFGTGWIAWFGIPRLRARGSGRVGGVELDVGAASVYHDHNWGRWHWGDDFGWEWGCFLPSAPAPAFVLSRVTDRRHARSDPALFVTYSGARRRWFLGPSLTVSWTGTLAAEPRRLPGAVAALHHDRAAPRVPAAVAIVADDGIDRVELDFEGRAVAQIIAADPARPGYGFIHEVIGQFRYTGRLGGEDWHGTGLAVVEYVD